MGSAIGVNLRRFRRLRKLTQQKLADAVGISRVAYRNIETGVSVPRVSTLNAVAGFLGVSVFDLSAETPKLKSLRFRSLKSLTAQEKAEREQIAVEVALWLKDFNELEDVVGSHKPFIFESIDFSSRDPEEAASEARAKLGLPCEESVPDVCELLEQAGIKLYLRESKLRSFFGLSVGQPDGGPAIAVNTAESIPVERRIFTAAHELGHLLLHQDSYLSDQIEEDQNQEAAANCFAGHFLMPQKAFECVWKENRGLNWVDSVLRTKRRFRVSYKTVLRRLIDMNLAENDIYLRFVDDHAQRYGKRLKYREEPSIPVTKGEEPSQLDGADFIQDRLGSLVRDALEKDLISIGRAAEILGMSTMQVRDRIREWEMFG